MSSREHKYDHPEGFEPNLTGGYPWSADRLLLSQIPDRSRVLELGCATGYMGKYLSEKKKCQMVGIEADPAAAEAARPYYEKLYTGDLDDPKTYAALSGQFQIILCAAVLEHLRQPGQVLKALSQHLAPNGQIVISLPNIAHKSIRAKLLTGRFDYADYGILDRTHLRFFTWESCEKMIAEAHLKVIEKRADYDSGFRWVTAILRRLPGGWRLLKSLYGLRPNFFAYQMILKAIPNEGRPS